MRVGSVAAGAGREFAPAAPIGAFGRPWYEATGIGRREFKIKRLL